MSGLFVHRNLLLGIVSKRALVFSSNLLAKLQKGRGNSVVKELGRLTAAQIDTEPYLPGQLFIHKLFPYRGIVLCSFACPVEEKLPNSSSGDSVVITQKSLFYQILVHSGDWKNMHFPVDITSYLEDAGSMHAEKALTVIFGMDCVAHDEIIPFRTQSIRPITHDLFRGLFECTAVEDNDFVFGIRKEPSFLISQNSRYVLKQLRPHFVYRETTDGIRVTVITFYLGLNTVGGLQKHWWRYVIRLENLEPCSIIVRSREMKVYSLSNMQQQRAPNIAGGNPRLTPEEPAFQYSGTVGVAVDKGSYAWGNFTMEREEDRTSFLVRVPTFRLEYDSSLTPEKTEQLS
ncbi:unnamed protein product [Thelazia callipaeda]|uniref:ApaG domain-containing protein n=1 Tax=Thelazia callipaeda TaxID=103827 RepID=A0A0N5D1P1_THECL|nr:unnamed protein product [Thelazia callipaeda]